ncbi:MAG TPA: DNA double-strand break repair nuclease NurA [Candidatus Babeliales bacterium]|nr:DNA double-strand break repair nuclease NurA [Candidatus Babeliales bacterium]
MLDHAKVMKALQEQANRLFAPIDDELDLVRVVWHALAKDPDLISKIKNATTHLLVPNWREQIDKAYPINPQTEPYRVIGIDGSQIYPDRHQNASCALVNIGVVELEYGLLSKAHVATKPSVLIDDSQGFSFTEDLINARRQEFELQAATDLASFGISIDRGERTLILFDGSLIFWHLQSYDEAMKTFFIDAYNKLLMKLYGQGIWSAWYISLPKSKELVNLVRLALCDYNTNSCEALNKVDHIVDSHIASFFLPPMSRSIVFEHRSPVIDWYEPLLRPYFFYLNGEDEIGRTELPAWIANDQVAVQSIAEIILDQMKKGFGYPVCLAEAHEQAVVKGPDRDFFYHLLARCGMNLGRSFSISQKSAKKRRMNV